MSTESEHGDLGRKHQLHGVQPVLPVADVAASAKYFRDFLGFDIEFLEGNPPVHGRVMKGDGTYGSPIYIHLSKARLDEVRPSCELRIHVGRDLDGLFDAYRSLGVAVVFPPTSQPWGLRELCASSMGTSSDSAAKRRWRPNKRLQLTAAVGAGCGGLGRPPACPG